MNNLEKIVIEKLKELKTNKELKKIKNYPVYFILLAAGESYTNSIKEKLVKLIKDGKITIFGALYTGLSNESKKHIDDLLRKEKYFSGYGIGLPE
jgi:hypothetical protein